MVNVEQLVQMYKDGIITHYELFARVRDIKGQAGLPEEMLKDFKVWDSQHPEEKCRSFCIVA